MNNFISVFCSYWQLIHACQILAGIKLCLVQLILPTAKLFFLLTNTFLQSFLFTKLTMVFWSFCLSKLPRLQQALKCYLLDKYQDQLKLISPTHPVKPLKMTLDFHSGQSCFVDQSIMIKLILCTSTLQLFTPISQSFLSWRFLMTISLRLIILLLSTLTSTVWTSTFFIWFSSFMISFCICL